MNALRRIPRFVVGPLLLAAALAACDSGDPVAPPATGFPGDARLPGMWAAAVEEGYQAYLHVAYDQPAATVRVRRWTYDTMIGCYAVTADYTIGAASVTPTTIAGETGGAVSYSISGQTLTVGGETLSWSNRTAQAMAPGCGSFPEHAALVGLWREWWGAQNPNATQGFVQIGGYLRGDFLVRYPGAGGCWERARQTAYRYAPLADDQFVEEYYWEGAPLWVDTVTVGLAGNRLTISREYSDGQTGYNLYDRSDLATGPACSFRLLGWYAAHTVNGSPLPYTYTARNGRTYLVDHANVGLYPGPNTYTPFVLYQSDVTGGGTGVRTVHDLWGEARVTSSSGAFAVNLQDRDVFSQVSLSGAAVGDGVTVSFNHAGLDAPLVFEMARSSDFLRPGNPAAGRAGRPPAFARGR